jgi:hypothetical protein
VIVLPRALARLFRTVLRRSVDQGPRREWPLIQCQASAAGLRLSALRGAVGVCYHEAGDHPEDALVFRSWVLEQIEGRTSDPVTLEQIAAGKARARWNEDAAPRIIDFETVTLDRAPSVPLLPSKWEPMTDHFLMTLDEAARSTAKESARYALTCVQLRGRAGQVIATDGKQLLIQDGFRFPWVEDFLVPRVPAFGLRELSLETPIAVGRTEQDVVVRAGRWTFSLAIDTTSRFPDAQSVVPKPSAVTCRLFFDEADAAFLVQALPKLPGQDNDHSPVTLDLNRQALLRVRSREGCTVTEIELSRSRVEGKAVRLCLDRTNLRRALQLGFTEVLVREPDTPVLCRDRHRLFVFVPLDKQEVLTPSKEAVRIPSSSIASSPLPKPLEQHRERRKPTMPSPHANHDPSSTSRVNGASAECGPTIAELVAEAEALRTIFQDSSARLSRLIAGLKQLKRQSQAMRAAVQSLRQLKLDV